MVSVIITTYKRSVSVVERAINSILCQTYKDIEIIVVDDNSNGSDESINLKNAFETRRDVKYIKQNGNKGACAARNLGIANASGEYIGFLDDDDEWIPTKLEHQLDKFDECGKECGMVYGLGAVVYIDEIPERVEPYYTTDIFKDVVSFDDMLEKDYCGSTSQALVRRDVFDKVGGFDESLPARQDYEMWIRISRTFKICGLNEIVFRYIQHNEDQITKNYKKALTGYRIVYSKYKDEYKRNVEAHIILLQRMMQVVEDKDRLLFRYYQIYKHVLMLMKK